jgi:hypothetical protein
MEGGDDTAQFALPRPVVDPRNCCDGLPSMKQQFRARVNDYNPTVSDYQLSQI